MTPPIGSWRVSQQQTEQIVLLGDPDSSASVLILLKNDGPNPVLVQIGFDRYTTLQSGLSMTFLRNASLVVRAQRDDGSPAQVPRDTAALEAHGTFEILDCSCQKAERRANGLVDLLAGVTGQSVSLPLPPRGLDSLSLEGRVQRLEEWANRVTNWVNQVEAWAARVNSAILELQRRCGS